MIAGRLKYRLTILKPLNVVNDYGEEVQTFIETTTVRAERVKHSGRRSEEVGEHFPDYSAEYNVRAAHPVEENWRVKEVDGYLYTVTNIIPNKDKGYKTLVCVRVNE